MTAPTFVLNFAVVSGIVAPLACQQVGGHGSVIADAAALPQVLADGCDLRAAYVMARHRVVEGNGFHQARNPGQGWLVRFEDGGFVVEPAAGSWSWGLALESYGFVGDERDVTAPSAARAQGCRMSYRWDALLEEWYVNDTRGLEHGYTVRRRPPGDTGDAARPLAFTLAVRGGLSARVCQGGRGVSFLDSAGATVLTYTGLTVFDADGEGVPARLERSGDRLRLLVEESAARYPLTIDPLAQQAYLKASNTDVEDWFGYSVAASGDTVVVGAWGEDSAARGINGDQADNTAQGAGAVYVFARSGGAWSQQAYLKASNAGAGDQFGYSVSVDGDVLVVGAPGEDSRARSVNGNQADNGADYAGAAYVFVRSGGVWSQQAYLKASNADSDDLFGFCVAASGDTVSVGSHGESSNATGVNGNQSDNSAPQSGAAYVFVRSGTTWTQQAYLKASNADIGDIFGACLSVSGDTLVVSAERESSNATGVNGNQSDNSAARSGAAYVFARSGATWSQQAYLKASNTDPADLLGFSVSAFADTVVVCAPGESSRATGVNGKQADNSASRAGAAYVFARSGATWSQQAYLKAPNAEAGDEFGCSVSLSGDRVVVGALYEDSNASGVNGNGADNSLIHAGAAYVLERNGLTWNQLAYLKASSPDIGDYFGLSVSSSAGLVVVGAYGEDSGATGVGGNEADNSVISAGAAYVLDRCGAFARNVGAGCIANGTVPSLRVTPPVQGGVCRLSVASALPGSAGVVLLGLQHPGISLGGRCTAYLDLTLPTVPIFFATDAAGAWSSPSIPVSSSASLTCVEMALQAGLDDPLTSPLGLALSNGVWVKIGF